MPRRGAHTPSGGTRPPRPPPSREVTVSKAMSYILRHAAEKEGLKLDENGYANVADLLAWPKLKSLHVTFPELRQIVLSNDKQRFALLRIPANLLTPLPPTSASFPPAVVHGTTPQHWAQILASGGLSRMRRTHIHFATGLPSSGTGSVAATKRAEEEEEGEEGGKEAVVSGMRASASVLVWVDARRAVEEGGLEWWRSGNGVVLTEGDGRGMVGLRFVTRVVWRGSGEVLWMPDGREGGGVGIGGGGKGGGIGVGGGGKGIARGEGGKA